METDKFDIKQYLADKASLVNNCLDGYFPKTDTRMPKELLDAMRYSLLAGGKRLRPVLAIASYEAFGKSGDDILECASALEAIHTYSLIHDDLPSMDDDDLRRGMPTNHKVYGEAIAILAGDGLLSEAFLMILSISDRVKQEYVFEAVREVAQASGPRGMVGGQVQDMLSENATPDKDMLEYIHRHKTGALLASSVRLGGILAGAGKEDMSALSTYGWGIGLAFQIVDDILDVRGDQELLGKPVGSDEGKNKMTYPALYGIDTSMKKAEELIHEAVDVLSPLEARGCFVAPLKEIAFYILRRSH
jgi:geranylgeranyl diphosphate synthase type II